MKTVLILIIGLAATLLFVSASVIHNQDAAQTIPCACDDTGRYDKTEMTGGGERVMQTSACTMIKKFEQMTGSNRGGFISKKVFDNIFCNKTFNGINFYFAMDTTRESKTVRLVIEGAHLSNTLPGDLGASTERYISRTICPPACGSLSMAKCK
jgi:hypothetical protein